MLSWLFSKKVDMVLSEFEAQQEYRRYQASVMTNDRMLTFLEWVIETKTVLKDVSAEEQALLYGTSR
jgi:hypothetical protein